MNAQNFSHERRHLVGESAVHPMAPHCGTLAAFFRLAGTRPPRRCALPERHSATSAGASSCDFQDNPHRKENVEKRLGTRATPPPLPAASELPVGFAGLLWRNAIVGEERSAAR